jgi:hypothetical protein
MMPQSLPPIGVAFISAWQAEEELEPRTRKSSGMRYQVVSQAWYRVKILNNQKEK